MRLLMLTFSVMAAFDAAWYARPLRGVYGVSTESGTHMWWAFLAVLAVVAFAVELGLWMLFLDPAEPKPVTIQWMRDDERPEV